MNANGPMAHKVCVVTGATSGIGYETALGLARLGAEVIGVGRSADRALSAGLAIREASGSPAVSFEVADLASATEVRELAGRIRRRVHAVHVLVNNAGVFTARRRLSVDGVELQLAVNCRAPFLLTHELMPLLAAAPEARVITVSSGSHVGAGLRWLDPDLRGRYHGLWTYGACKLAGILVSYELARRLGAGSRISTYAVDPGLVNTDMGLKDASRLVRLVWLLRRRGGVTANEGARTSVFLASDPEARRHTGAYWKECAIVPSSPESHDPDAATQVWRLMGRLAGLGGGGFRLPKLLLIDRGSAGQLPAALPLLGVQPLHLR